MLPSIKCVPNPTTMLTSYQSGRARMATEVKPVNSCLHMKIALLSDIHGNDIALNAVLNDIENQGGVDTHWILGDLVAIGHAPIEVLQCLQRLNNVKIIRGNTDRYVCTGDRPSPTFDEVKADLTLLGQLVEVEADFAWTQGAVTVAGWLDWLSALPIEHREVLPDGTNVLCVHASPNNDDGSGILPDMSQQEIAELLSGGREDLICIGHTHRPFSLHVNDKHIVNPGSVSNPVGEDIRACYAVIQVDRQGYEVELRRVVYDVQAVIALLEQMRHPASNFIASHFHINKTLE